jgi:predicted  nucleic acid-binding Zn-ribbon protein
LIQDARLSQIESLVRLHDLDMLIRDTRDAQGQEALKKMGFRVSGLSSLEEARAEIAQTIAKRWMVLYERLFQRYGRAVVPVKDRVCLGCFVTLPTSALPPPADSNAVTVCESCGRILYWL